MSLSALRQRQDDGSLRRLQGGRSARTTASPLKVLSLSESLDFLPLRPRLKLLARAAEGGKRLFEVVRQESHAEKIFPGRALGARVRLSNGCPPLLRLEVAPPDPGERDERRGLVDIEILDEFD